MNSDTGFSCHQLDKDDVYQIDNSKSSCALFMIQGQVNLDLGEFYEGEMEQGQMLYIPREYKSPDRIHNRFEMYSLVLG